MKKCKTKLSTFLIAALLIINIVAVNVSVFAAKTITVSGTFDGKGKTFKGFGDGSQKEDQPCAFHLKKGATLKNVVIGHPAGDGIHVEGNNTIENVVFTDVGEDAISMRSSAPGGTITIKNCKFSKGEDKIFQVNKSSTWNIKNVTVRGAGKVLRQNGGKTFAMKVNIDGLDATGVKESIVRSDSSKCVVTWKNIKCNLPKNKWWKGKLKVQQK